MSRSTEVAGSDCGGGSEASFAVLAEEDGLCVDPLTCSTVCARGRSDALELTLDAGDKGRSSRSRASELPLAFLCALTSTHTSVFEAERGGSLSSLVDAGVVGVSCCIFKARKAAAPPRFLALALTFSASALRLMWYSASVL